MIKVSVILVTCNSANYLQRTIDSVLMQKGRGEFFMLELIVVDDCSSDNTPEILSQNNISYKTTDFNTGGPNKGRNIALDSATGDYICFIDHDDEWEPEKTLLQIKAANYAPVITTGYSLVYESGHKTDRVLKNREPVIFGENETFYALLKRDKNRQNTCLSTIMIKQELKNIFFEEHFGMTDYDWLLRLFEGHRSVEVTQCLVKRHISDLNLSLNDEYRKRDFYYMLLTYESYEKKYPKYVKTGRKRAHGSRARYYYLTDRMKSARTYFLKGPIDFKALAFILTSFAGSSIVRKYFRFFG